MTLRPLLTLAIPILLASSIAVGAPTLDSPALTQDYFGPRAAQYIENYHDFAVLEMQRTAVPASITLAQGMLESAYGTSELAVNANNHFGIKCHKGWFGETYSHHSSENTNGSMIARKSCFRAYGTVSESFQDHSDFLASRSNYSELFLSNTIDYKVWANGLLQAGYATDPDYAKKLIATIQAHDLGVYDRYTNTTLAFNNSTEELEYSENLASLKNRIHTLECILLQSELHRSELSEKLNVTNQELAELQEKHAKLSGAINQKISVLQGNLEGQNLMMSALQSRLLRVEHIQQDMLKSDPLISHFNADGTAKLLVDIFPERQMDEDGIFYQSGRKATIASENRNLFEIAEEYDICFKDLLRFNDLEDDSDLPTGYYVYTEAKANYVKNQSKPHQVAIGETIHTISQRYGIKSSKLYQRNHMIKGEEPKSGEFVFLNKTNSKQPKLDKQTTESDFGTKFGGGGATHR